MGRLCREISPRDGLIATQSDERQLQEAIKTIKSRYQQEREQLENDLNTLLKLEGRKSVIQSQMQKEKARTYELSRDAASLER